MTVSTFYETKMKDIQWIHFIHLIPAISVKKNNIHLRNKEKIRTKENYDLSLYIQIITYRKNVEFFSTFIYSKFIKQIFFFKNESAIS